MAETQVRKFRLSRYYAQNQKFPKALSKGLTGAHLHFLASSEAGIFLVKKRIPILSELPPLSHSAKFLRWSSRHLKDNFNFTNFNTWYL